MQTETCLQHFVEGSETTVTSENILWKVCNDAVVLKNIIKIQPSGSLHDHKILRKICCEHLPPQNILRKVYSQQKHTIFILRKQHIEKSCE